MLNGVFSWWLLRRAAWLWLLMRLTIAFLFGVVLGAEGQGPPRFLRGAPTAIYCVALTITALFFEVTRRREWILFGNVGVGPLHVCLLGALAAAMLEATILLLR